MDFSHIEARFSQRFGKFSTKKIFSAIVIPRWLNQYDKPSSFYIHIYNLRMFEPVVLLRCAYCGGSNFLRYF